jgi:anti-sigma-K factor RskA
MSYKTFTTSGTEEDPDLAIDEDEFLIQRYLDSDLDPQELRNFESRLDVEVALQQRLEQCQALFSALDSSALARSALMWSEEVPTNLVERAIERWQETSTETTASPNELPNFAGLFQPGRVLAAANVALLLILAVMGIQRGPAELLLSWTIAAKDFAFFFASSAPSPQQLAYGLPVVLVSCIAGILILQRVARGLLLRGR